MVAYDGQHEIVSLAQQCGAHVKAGANLVAAGFELAQPETAVSVRPAKRGGQFTQPREQVSARACRQCGELGGGATRLEDSHRGKRG